LLCLALALGACYDSAGVEGEVRIGAMRGVTAIGMVKFIEDAPANITFEIVSHDEIVPLLVRGDVDSAAVPANLAATLYNNTKGSIRVLAVNTLGVTYIVETGNEIRSIQDLRGKTVIAVGKGTTPDITLRHILMKNGIDPDRDLTLEFRSEPGEVVAWLNQNGGIAMLPQPFVTTAMDNTPGLREALSLTVEWDKLDMPGPLITGVFVARAEFLEREKDLAFVMEQYRKSVEWVTGSPALAAPLVEGLGIAPAGVAERAIPKCHITLVEGAEMKQMLESYLAVLFENAPESVGGALPDEIFYHVP
jgi:NitT/TauT family transport system substrate-binding protein